MVFKMKKEFNTEGRWLKFFAVHHKQAALRHSMKIWKKEKRKFERKFEEKRKWCNWHLTDWHHSSVVYKVRCFHQTFIELFTRWVIQFTFVCFCSVFSKIKVNTNAVVVQVATTFTRVSVNHPDVCYGMVNKTLSHEKQSGWESQYTAFIWKFKP